MNIGKTIENLEKASDKELEEMAKRMCGAKMLDTCKVYTEISDNTGLSTATISRINRCLKYGNGGYREIIRRLDRRGVRLPEDDSKFNF